MGAKVTHNTGFGGLVLDDVLGSLEIGDAFRGQESDLRRLKWLANVPVLILSGKKVSDDWLKHAASLPGLEELHVYQASINDTALAALAEHSTLKLLGIYYTPVGDAALASLAKIPMLGYLKLYGTKITGEAYDKFRESSGLGIDYKRGAFLGVGGIEVEGGCLISTVHDGSPAEKGGLLREDLIVRFGGDPVANFSSLMGLIAKRDINEEVEIEVKRRTVDDQGNPAQKTIATTVKLVPWEAELAVRNPRR
jgi:C-terminal processing protease CtpA/Prc